MSSIGLPFRHSALARGEGRARDIRTGQQEVETDHFRWESSGKGAKVESRNRIMDVERDKRRLSG